MLTNIDAHPFPTHTVSGMMRNRHPIQDVAPRAAGDPRQEWKAGSHPEGSVKEWAQGNRV
jgi:hypothetical protein